MFCWQARRRLADPARPPLPHDPDKEDALAQHLRGCEACRLFEQDQAWIAALAGEAGQAPGLASPGMEGDRFEKRVLDRIGALAAATQGPIGSEPTIMPASGWPLAVRVSAAFSILLVAALAAGVTRGPRQTTPGSPEDPLLTMARIDDLGAAVDAVEPDAILPPREIPFTIREDLVGIRHGRIPAVTYVLDPPPTESAVMRASF
ncbi:MAG: hypothetical protein ACE5HU_08145 [Acidobacteriota bacterium]